MATELNIVIEQGATLSQPIAVGAAYNGQSARAKVRSAFVGSAPWQVSNSQILAELTCSAISGGFVTIGLTAAQTALLLAPTWARDDERKVVIGFWDLECTNGDTVTRLRQGRVTLSREATT